MENLFTLLKLCLQNLRHPPLNKTGFTLIELILAVALSFLMLGFATQLIVNQRKQFVSDRAQTQVSETLRSGMDIVGNDIRQAGESVNDNLLPVVSVADSTAPNRGQILVLQRKLTPVQLYLCNGLPLGTNLLVVKVQGSLSNRCKVNPPSPLPVPPPPLLDVEVQNWRNFRCNGDEGNDTACTRNAPLANASACKQNGGSDQGCVWAYIYDPAKPNKTGDFFLSDFEALDAATNNLYLHRIDGPGWPSGNSYPAINPNNPPSIYILEERRYDLVPDDGSNGTSRTDDYTLELTLNRQTNNRQRLVNNLSNFQVETQIPSGTAAPLPFNLVNGNPVYLTNWRTIQQMKLTLTAVNYPETPSNQSIPSGVKVPDANLKLESQFLPRNALSNPAPP